MPTWLLGINFKIYGAIALAVVFAALVVAVKVQTARLHASEQKYDAFVTKIEAIGAAQIAANRLKYQKDLALKGKLDYENKTLRTNLADTARRLSDSRAGSGFLSAIPAVAGSAPITADPAKLEAALRAFDTGVAILIDQGDSAIADLNTGKSWITEQAAK